MPQQCCSNAKDRMALRSFSRKIVGIIMRRPPVVNRLHRLFLYQSSSRSAAPPDKREISMN